MSKPLLGLLCSLALMPALALAMPRPRPAESVEYRIVSRHTSAKNNPPVIAFKAHRTDDGFVLHKLRGPETIEILLGAEMKGNFVADIDIDIAGFGELGIGANGGTPVPYYGFRSSDGKDESYFNLSTYGGGWHPHSIRIRRQNGKLTSERAGFPPFAQNRPIQGAGFVCFVMNDTSKIRIRHLSVQPIADVSPKTP